MAAPEQFDEAFLKKLEYLYIISKKIASGAIRAKRKTRIVGSGLEFADYREYSPGDDLRNIDWRVYARTEKLFLKLFEEEEDLYLYFLIDTSPSMFLGDPNKWEYAKRLVASLSYIGLANLDRVSIIPFSSKLDGRLPPSRGRAQIFKVFDFLKGLEPGDSTSLGEAFRTFVTQNKRRGMAIVVSDFYDPDGFEDGLNFLRYHKFEPLIVQLYDTRELNPNFRGDLQLVDCETGDVADITVTSSMMDEYVRAFEKFSDGLEEYCTKRQILYFRTPIQVEFDELVLTIFRAGGFLK